MCPSLLCYWGLTLLMRTSQHWGAEVIKLRLLRLTFLSTAPPLLQMQMMNLGMECCKLEGFWVLSHQKRDWFKKSFLHTRTVIFLHTGTVIFYTPGLWVFLLIRTMFLFLFFFFLLNAVQFFFVVDKNLFNASSNIFMSDIHNNLTRHIFHIYVLNI